VSSGGATLLKSEQQELAGNTKNKIKNIKI
jgi:hypothetical protein